jgi:hypothetical protein
MQGRYTVDGVWDQHVALSKVAKKLDVRFQVFSNFFIACNATLVRPMMMMMMMMMTMMMCA